MWRILARSGVDEGALVSGPAYIAINDSFTIDDFKSVYNVVALKPVAFRCRNYPFQTELTLNVEK